MTSTSNNDEAIHQYDLGIAYCTGEGRSKDTKEGAKYLQLAADQNYAPAIRDLASLYLSGDGVPPDAKKAYTLMKQAADAMDPAAMYRLGLMYEKGLGVPTDLYEALKLVAYAAGAEYEGAADDADRIECIIDQNREKRLRSRPVLNLEVSDVDVETACCKKMLDSMLAGDIYVAETFEGPELLQMDDAGVETPLTKCPFCGKPAKRVARDKPY